jgi:hypothetical protein
MTAQHPDEIEYAKPGLEYQGFRRKLRKLARLLENCASLKFRDANFADQLEAAVGKVPSSVDIAEDLELIRDDARNIVRAERDRRHTQFGTVLAAFVRGIRERGVIAREYEKSWRVGKLEIELQAERSRARVLYNREVVIPWRGISAASDFDELLAKGLERLDAVALPTPDLVEIVPAAFEWAARQRSTNRVAALDFLSELRLELVRGELRDRGPGVKIKRAEFPLWALYYNLDLYRALGDQVPVGSRISFETGDQQTVSQTLGIRLGGLYADSDYQVFSYVGRSA